MSHVEQLMLKTRSRSGPHLPGALRWSFRCAAMWLVVLCQSTLAAVDDAGAIEAAQQSLRRAGRFPWYDSSTDQPRAIPLPDEPELTASPDWARSPRPNQQTNEFGLANAFWRMIQVIVWVALACALAATLYIWLRDDSLSGVSSAANSTARRSRSEAELIEQLPFSVSRPRQDLLGEARRYYEQQDFRAAIIYLFSYQLVQLDRHHRIQLEQGKTNRQYLYEIRHLTRLREILATTILAFERVFFGDRPLDRASFEVCWNQLPEFESALQDPPIV